MLAFNVKAAQDHLKVSVAIIPGHSEMIQGRAAGGFVEVAELIASEFGGGAADIELFPFARSIDNILRNKAHFHLPLIRPLDYQRRQLDFYYVDEPITKVTFVLYTKVGEAEIQFDALDDILIDTQRGHGGLFSFPTVEVNNIQTGINKVLKGRSNGFIFEQDAVDSYLKQNKIKGIKRHFFAQYDSAIIVPKTKAGVLTARKLSAILKLLKKQGRLQPVSEKIHRPYIEWQPIEQ